MYHTHDKSLICGGSLGAGGDFDTFMFTALASVTCLNLTSSGWVNTRHSLYDWYRSPQGRWRHTSWAVDDGFILMGGYA